MALQVRLRLHSDPRSSRQPHRPEEDNPLLPKVKQRQ